MADRYLNFAALEAEQSADVDYRVRVMSRATSIVLVAPHGGSIEPGSSQIAEAIAREDYSLYCFEGLQAHRAHGDLHIKSERFDEPRALELVGESATAVAVHGRADRDDPQTVWMGGRADALRDAIASSLRAAGFPASTSGHNLPGRATTNICNRGTTGAGVQLEIPRTLRNQLVGDEIWMGSFADAVRNALTSG
jgi:phage replication-related protein YjqB (UPF0714/DUF867 family)